jgi:hypothetical protein
VEVEEMQCLVVEKGLGGKSEAAKLDLRVWLGRWSVWSGSPGSSGRLAGWLTG